MDSVVFIGVLACAGLVVGWYVINENRDGNGRIGLLAIADNDLPDDGQTERGYRTKARARPASAQDRLNTPKNARAYRAKKAKPVPRSGADKPVT